MVPVDFFATERHFADHLAGVWHALPEEARGDFIVTRPIVDIARSRVPGAKMQTDHPERPIVIASRGDQKRARLAKRRRIAYLEHGAGQSYPGAPTSATSAGYSGGTDHEDVGLFLVPNAYSGDRWRAAYPKARVEVVGSPKVERLPRRVGNGDPVVALSFHWQCGVVPETMSALGHFRPAFPSLVKRWLVIGHGHPRAIFGEPWLRHAYLAAGIERVDDFLDVCRRADVYVCDNSSTIYEFAATGRPVVVLNAPGYRKNVKHGGRFWDWATIGPQVDKPADLADAVALALSDPPKLRAERERILDLVYQPRTGGASLAAAALVDWAQEAP